MEIRITKTENYLKIEKIAKKELLIRIIIFLLIVFYFFITTYKKYGRITIFLALLIFPVGASFYLAFISNYPYEVLIIKNGKMIRYVSLFYRHLKIEKIAKKELLIRIIIFSTILLYIFFKLYKLSPIFIIIFPILLAFEYVFIIKYLYEVIIINKQKIVVYVSLFYRHLKFYKLFNFLQVYDIDNLKHIYFKNTTEILVIKAIKRTESPYHKIHLTFKDKSYTAFGVKMKDEVAKDIVLTINKFLEKCKKEGKIKRLTLAEKENLSEKYNYPLDERYSYILNKILDEEKLFISEKGNNFIINGDSEAIKDLEIFKDMNFEEIDFYVFYVNYLSKKEYENKKVLVGYNGIDGKEVTMSKFKEDINEIRDSRSTFKN